MRYRWPADTVFTRQVLLIEQQACRVMRRARSKKQRPALIAELERRYQDAP